MQVRILVAGYYGFGNLGDEMILSSVLAHLRDRYGAPRICVLSASPRETKAIHHVSAVSRWDPLALTIELWRADFVILGGGGLLQNQTSQRSLLYYMAIVAVARLFRLPVILYALGVESLAGRFAQRLVGWLLRSPLVTITVRDEVSAEILSGIGIRRETIHITADPVFSKAVSSSRKERYSINEPSVLLIPRFPCPSSGRSIFAVIGRVLKDQKKMNVRGLLFHPQMEKPYLSSVDGEAVLTEQDFLPDLNWEEAVDQLTRFDWIISARFHGLVLAALAGKPFIGVGDEHKVGRLCLQFNMPYLSWDVEERDIHAALYKISLASTAPYEQIVERLRESSLRTAEFVR